MDKQAIIQSIHENLDQEVSFQDEYIESKDYASNYFTDGPNHISSSDKEDRIGRLLSHYDIPGHVRDVIETLGLEVKLFNHLYRDATPAYCRGIHRDDSHLDSVIIGECELDLGKFLSMQPDGMSDEEYSPIVKEAIASYSGNLHIKEQKGYYYGYLTYDYERIVLPVEKGDLVQAILSLFGRDTISSKIREAYKKDISSRFAWDIVKQEIRSSLAWDKEADQFIGRCLLGSVMRLTPSGKVYALWTSNQNRFDEELDFLWSEALESVLKDHHLSRDDFEENIFVIDGWDIDSLPATQDELDSEGFSFLTTEDHAIWEKHHDGK